MKLRETSEGKAMIEKCGNPPVVTLNGITELLQIAEKAENAIRINKAY